MNKFVSMIRAKPWHRLAAYILLLAGLVADFVFIAVNGQDQTFTLGCFLCVLAGSVLGLLDFFLRCKGVFLWGASLLYIAACAFHLTVALPSISDLWNNVNFIGGNQEAAIVFGIIFLAIMLFLIVLNFFGDKQSRPEKE